MREMGIHSYYSSPKGLPKTPFVDGLGLDPRNQPELLLEQDVNVMLPIDERRYDIMLRLGVERQQNTNKQMQTHSPIFPPGTMGFGTVCVLISHRLVSKQFSLFSGSPYEMITITPCFLSNTRWHSFIIDWTFSACEFVLHSTASNVPLQKMRSNDSSLKVIFLVRSMHKNFIFSMEECSAFFLRGGWVDVWSSSPSFLSRLRRVFRCSCRSSVYFSFIWAITMDEKSMLVIFPELKPSLSISSPTRELPHPAISTRHSLMG